MFSEYPYLNFSDYNLDWVIKMTKEMIATVKSFDEWKEETEGQLNDLLSFKAAMESGNFPDAMMRKFYEWCQDNVPKILKEAVKTVYFGLTDSGYFYAWIPDGWQDIVFNTTGYDIDVPLQPDYGHLVLSSNAASRTVTY